MEYCGGNQKNRNYYYYYYYFFKLLLLLYVYYNFLFFLVVSRFLSAFLAILDIYIAFQLFSWHISFSDLH